MKPADTSAEPGIEPTPSPQPSRASSRRPLMIMAVAVLLLAGAGLVWWLTKPVAKPVNAGPTSTTGVLRIGSIIDEDGVDANRKEFQPFIDYLVSQLHEEGITKGEFVPKTSVTDMAKLLREDQVDVYIDSIFPVFVADRLAESSVIADRWKDGVEKYHTAIFAQKGSSIKTVADLKGKMLAFDSSTSTVGYFLPKAELAKQGYKLTEKAKPTDPVAPDEIGYVFVHDKVFDDVQQGVTPAGGESEQEIRDHFGASFDQNYRIVMTTPDVLRFAVSARKGLDPKLLTAIKHVLLTMDQTDAGRAALKSFSDTAKFTDVGTDSDAAYGEVRKLTDYVESEIVRGGVGADQPAQ
jgi:phosphonate transport system substrate-binding protein